MSEEAAQPERRRRPLRRRIARLLVIVALMYAGWCVLLYFVQGRMMFPRDLTSAPTPEEIIPRTITRLWIDTGAGARTEAWLLPVQTAPGERAPAVIMAHGKRRAD